MKRIHRDRKLQPDSARNMTFAKAKRFIMPFGEYEGKTLDSIAETDTGLRHLDSLLGRRPPVYGRLRIALLAYLTDPGIAKELVDLIGPV